jgi:hypothetical protein
MNKRQTYTYHSDSLSLLPLNVVLTNARNNVLPQTQTPRKDVNEERALRLIEMMKLQFKKRAHPVHWMDSSTQLGCSDSYNETAGADV